MGVDVKGARNERPLQQHLANCANFEFDATARDTRSAAIADW
jgi:hypothetical protein